MYRIRDGPSKVNNVEQEKYCGLAKDIAITVKPLASKGSCIVGSASYDTLRTTQQGYGLEANRLCQSNDEELFYNSILKNT